MTTPLRGRSAVLPPRRPRQAGGLPLAFVTSLLLASTIAGAVAVRLASTDLRAAGAQRGARAGFYCAEGGLQAARPYFAGHVGQWNTMFDPRLTPPPGYPVRGDLDGDGADDYEVTLRDNVDEFPPRPNDPLHDSDLTAVMVARCVSPTMTPRVIEEVIVWNGRGADYRYQAGHSSSHSGNAN